MNKWIGYAVGAVMSLSVSTAIADDNLVVVELYTSQGCSSCPPADAILAELARQPDILPLALHVDYWDYIGWKDIYAQPDFTKRQKAYAHVAGLRSIYTPQMVVAGKDHIVGARERDLNEYVEAHKQNTASVEISVERNGNTLGIAANAAQALSKPAFVQLVRFMPEETVNIRRGENAGRSITYVNIVTEWRRLGDWSGDTAYSFETEIEGDDPVAIIIQEEGPGSILAATVLR